MSLLAKSRKEGQIQHITPQSAGWRYIGFDVWMLKKRADRDAGERRSRAVPGAGRRAGVGENATCRFPESR